MESDGLPLLFLPFIWYNRVVIATSVRMSALMRPTGWGWSGMAGWIKLCCHFLTPPLTLCWKYVATLDFFTYLSILHIFFAAILPARSGYDIPIAQLLNSTICTTNSNKILLLKISNICNSKASVLRKFLV